MIIIVKSNGGEVPIILKGTGNQTSNVAENTSLKLVIFPNPASHYLHIEGLPGKNVSCEIIHLNGQLLYKKQLGYSDNLVDVSTLHRGIYFVRIVDGTYRQTVKLVVE